MPGSEKPDEQQIRSLVARAQSGDARAFEKLLKLHQHGLLRFCRSMLGSSSEAEDVLQDVYLGAWRQLSTLKSSEALSVWLYRIARHRCIDHLRKRTPVPHDLHTEENSTGSVPLLEQRSTEIPEAYAENQAAMLDLRRYVGELPENQRESWVLKEIHHLSYASISEIVGEPVATVRGRIARARTTLAERMQPWR